MPGPDDGWETMATAERRIADIWTYIGNDGCDLNARGRRYVEGSSDVDQR